MSPFNLIDVVINYARSRRYRIIPTEINPKYSELIERTQVDLLTEDEPGIFGCLAFFKTK